MEEFKYITFTSDDIIEALEDLYLKKNHEKMDIRFNRDNVTNLRPLRSITIKKSLSLPQSDLIVNEYQTSPETISIGHEESEEKPSKSPYPKNSISTTLSGLDPNKYIEHNKI